MTVGEFKTNFSEALDAVRDGQTIVVEYGRNHEKVGAFVPYSQILLKERPLGLLAGKVQVNFAADFAFTDEEFLNS